MTVNAWHEGANCTERHARADRSREAVRILQFHTDSHPYSLGKARRYIRNALIQTGLNVDVVRRVEIAVGEVLTNTYRHGYDAGVGPVSIKVFRNGEGLMVVVQDSGRATAAPSVPRVPPPRTEYGGRGLYMVGRLVDDVAISVNPRGHGLTVQMTVRLDEQEARAS
jgi:anti-sigma regulatory factor (Ser/Thr protein kinase)